jgi:hypothetical protein
VPIDKDAVENFVAAVNSDTVSFLRANAERVANCDRLIERFASATATWNTDPSDNVRPITESVNELCIARKFLESEECAFVSYEPRLEGTNKTIDYLVETTNGQRIFFDVKTIHPEAKSAWERFKKITDLGLLSDNTNLVLDENWMGGEIAHSFLASREKFLDYTIELEAKIDAIQDKGELSFAMVFCGNGYDWLLDQLEDFADFYLSGQHRPDDPFARMEAYSIAEKEIAVKQTIDSFCYLERKIIRTTPCKFSCNVRGPTFPF